MSGLTIQAFAQTFFDKKAVTSAIGEASAKVMNRQGGYVRQVAKNSIRRGRRTEVSQPGQQPISHTGTLKRFIYYGYDRSTGTVVVGPARIANKPGLATSALEHGGGGAEDKKGNRFRIQARPFMGPALEKSQSKLAAFWKNSVSK